MALPPTSFTRLVGCRLPVQQAAMSGVSSVALTAAVAREGALGMVAGTGRSSDQIRADVAAVVAAAGGDARVGVNFLVPFLAPPALEAAASVATVVECFFGDPLPRLVDRVHEGGALMGWQVGSVEEAAAAADAGCDFVVVQGREAGGHVRGVRPLRELLEDARGRLGLPLVAAGGIGSGRAVAGALAAGADAVRIGTRLVATVEADAHQDYAAALVRSTADDTILTDTFALGWPDAPHRVLRSCVEASSEPPASRSPLPPNRAFAAGAVPAAALYAGESVSDVRRVAPASEVIRELVRDAVAVLDER